MVVANSIFTSKVYGNAFSSLKTITPEVIYPGIDIGAYVPLTNKEEKSLEVRMVKSSVHPLEPSLPLFSATDPPLFSRSGMHPQSFR